MHSMLDGHYHTLNFLQSEVLMKTCWNFFSKEKNKYKGKFSLTWIDKWLILTQYVIMYVLCVNIWVSLICRCHVCMCKLCICVLSQDYMFDLTSSLEWYNDILTHWPIGDVAVILTIIFRQIHYTEIVAWTLAMKLLPSECYKTSIRRTCLY